MASRKRARKRRAKVRRAKSRATNERDLQAQCDWFLGNGSIFAGIQFHGNVKWVALQFVWLALVWAWCTTRNVTDAFEEAAQVCQVMFGQAPLTTYQGFMGALVRWTPLLMPVLCGLLQQAMQKIGGRFWKVGGWVPIAFDGSRSSAPRTKSNEAFLCAPRKTPPRPKNRRPGSR